MLIAAQVAPAQQVCGNGNPIISPDERFVVNSDGTVQDIRTQLLWKQCSEGQSGASCSGLASTHNWSQALQMANASNFAGYADWRLPNIKELHSLIEYGCAFPSVNLHAFPNTTSGEFWSSTNYRGFPTFAWMIVFNYGVVYEGSKTGARYVRLVRTFTNGTANLPPAVFYSPAPASTVSYSGSGTASPISVTPIGGNGSGSGATTTIGACAISGGGAAFPTTSIGQLSFVGATTTSQNLVLPNCVPQASQANAVLSCPEVRAGIAQPNRTWTLTCPTVAIPPMVAYSPTPNSTVSYSSAGTASPISVTPSGGSGSGLGASTAVGACTITGGGAAFPTTTIAQLTFVGSTVTPQNLVLPNCVRQASLISAVLTCPETRGGVAQPNRIWSLTCPSVSVAPAVARSPISVSRSPKMFSISGHQRTVRDLDRSLAAGLHHPGEPARRRQAHGPFHGEATRQAARPQPDLDQHSDGTWRYRENPVAGGGDRNRSRYRLGFHYSPIAGGSEAAE